MQKELTKEEIDAEMERCKDPLYFYNKYFKSVEQPEMTQAEWDAKNIQGMAICRTRGGFRYMIASKSSNYV